MGAKNSNEPVGSCKWSDITVFSFHPVKMITTLEGGAALTKDHLTFKKLRLFSNHGITKDKRFFKRKNVGPWYYEQQKLGLNYRMSEVSAALGISQLKKLKKFFKKRNFISSLYQKNLSKEFIELPFITKNTTSSFHLYVIKLKKKAEHLHKKLFNFLRKNKINVNLHYLPVHLHPYYQSLGFKKGEFKFSEKHAQISISLPIYPNLEQKKIKLICKKINNFFKKNK